MAVKGGSKNGFVLFFLLLAGIVLGGFIGNLTQDVKFLSWLDFGFRFGMKSPLELDLKIIYIHIQLLFDITIASILGIVLAIFIYKKI